MPHNKKLPASLTSVIAHFVVIIAIIILGSISLFAYDKPTLAVLELQPSNVDEATVNAVTNLIQTRFVESNLYILVEREKLDAIFVEQDIQHLTSLTNRETVVQLGEILNAQKLFLGEIGSIGGTYILSGKVVNVQTGEIEISATENAKTVFLLEEATNRMVKKLVQRDMSDYQAYLRSRTWENGLRINRGLFIFNGAAKNINSSSVIYDISYTRKGFPFMGAHNWHTEYEIGYFLLTKDRNIASGFKRELTVFPSSINGRYYFPIPFFVDFYAKAGGGLSLAIAEVESASLGTRRTETSYDPFIRAGIGFNTSEKFRLGFHLEYLYQQFFMEGTDLSGTIVGAGFSYSW